MCCLFTGGCSSDSENPILEEYDRLWRLAVDGDANDKLTFFFYTMEHRDSLADYTGTALDQLVDASSRGSGEASFWLGYMSEEGIWTRQSDEEAMKSYLLSAEQGYAAGMHKCILEFAHLAEAAGTEDDKDFALNNAQKWYDAIFDLRRDSTDLFKSARFNYAVARLKINPSDEYGMTLLSDAAIDGHETAISIIREFYADASSPEFKGDTHAELVIKRWTPTIEIIGRNDQQIE